MPFETCALAEHFLGIFLLFLFSICFVWRRVIWEIPHCRKADIVYLAMQEKRERMRRRGEKKKLAKEKNDATTRPASLKKKSSCPVKRLYSKATLFTQQMLKLSRINLNPGHGFFQRPEASWHAETQPEQRWPKQHHQDVSFSPVYGYKQFFEKFKLILSVETSALKTRGRRGARGGILNGYNSPPAVVICNIIFLEEN
jgi:hypothetical protein